MSILAENASLLSKTRELCAEIVNSPAFAAMQSRVDRFLDDAATQAQYQDVQQQGEELHRQQHAGQTLSPAAIASFETARAALFENETARDFFDAQRELDGIQREIKKFVATTIELGRVPTDEDLAASEAGCCGGGGGGGGGCCH